MRDFDWDRVQREKELYRTKLASLSFAEKLRVLERLRERARAVSKRREPFSTAEREPVSQVASSLGLASDQAASGTIHLGALNANATIIVAKIDAASSALGQTSNGSNRKAR